MIPIWLDYDLMPTKRRISPHRFDLRFDHIKAMLTHAEKAVVVRFLSIVQPFKDWDEEQLASSVSVE
jgi:hypothetical protein